MSNPIRCTKCGGLLAGHAEHSADMPCTCLRKEINELRKEIAALKTKKSPEYVYDPLADRVHKKDEQ